MTKIEKLEAKVERKRADLERARVTARDLRTAKGPWAATNRKANKKLQNRLLREIAELSKELFREKMAADRVAKAVQV